MTYYNTNTSKSNIDYVYTTTTPTPTNKPSTIDYVYTTPTNKPSNIDYVYTTSPTTPTYYTTKPSTIDYVYNNTYSPYSPYISTIYGVNDTSYKSLLIDSPVLNSLNLTDYTVPVAGSYINLNADQDVIDKMVKYLYYKLLDNWMLDDLSSILKYFSYNNDKVELVKDISKAVNNRTESDKVAMKKIDYIEKHIFTKKDMYKLLRKIVEEYRVNWYDLSNYESLIKRKVKDKLKSIIKNKI